MGRIDLTSARFALLVSLILLVRTLSCATTCWRMPWPLLERWILCSGTISSSSSFRMCYSLPFFPAARSTGSAKLDGAVTYIDELEVVDLSKCIYPSASHYLARGKISCTFAFFSKSLRIHSKAGAVTSKANRNEDIRWID